MKKFLPIIIVACMSMACATLNKTMYHTEAGLKAGSDAWNTHVDEVIESCRDKALETVEERVDCVRETTVANDTISAILSEAIVLIRQYWTAVSTGKDPKEVAAILARIPGLLDPLPDEFFGGLK